MQESFLQASANPNGLSKKGICWLEELKFGE